MIVIMRIVSNNNSLLYDGGFKPLKSVIVDLNENGFAEFVRDIHSTDVLNN